MKISWLVSISCIFELSVAFAQDRVTIAQWSSFPPPGVSVLYPCPCFQPYVANKFIVINACTSAIAGIAVRRPIQSSTTPAIPDLTPAPDKKFAAFSLEQSDYLVFDSGPELEFGILTVSCPATPNFVQSTGIPRCVAQRWSQPPIVCRKDPAANVGDQCSCAHPKTSQLFNGEVRAVPPSPLD